VFKNIIAKTVIIFVLFLVSGGVINAQSTSGNNNSADRLVIGCEVAKINTYPTCTTIDTDQLGFQIPSLGDILTFAIRVFFIIAGLAALFYMLIGAFTWITSGGDEEATTGARNKIQAAVFGMILIVGVLAIIWTLEQVIFNRRICLGLSCTLTLPSLVKVTEDPVNCCVCLKNDGTRGGMVNTSVGKCKDGGVEGI
jgi:hypothetical protein